MHRVNIVYVGDTDTRFDWHHYLNKHLPIACGVSSRHAPIIRCDVDRPVKLNSQADVTQSEVSKNIIVAICTVYFSSLTAQNDFRHFFASNHQDATQILADEPNYTTIQPSFNAGHFRASDNAERRTEYRVKFLFPRAKKLIDIDMVHADLESLAAQLENQGIEISGKEIDECQFDVPPDVPSAFECMAAVNVADQKSLAQISQYLSATRAQDQNFGTQLGVRPLVIFSEVVNFDLALCAPYLQPGLENSQ